MAVDYTVTALLSAIKDDGMLPPQTNVSDTARLMGFLNREQRGYLSALLLRLREEYQSSNFDVPLVAGQLDYMVPRRAMGAKLKVLRLVDEGGGERDLYPVAAGRKGVVPTGGVGDYFFRGNRVVLCREMGGTLRFVVPRRLGQLVEVDEVLEIASVDGAFINVVGDPALVTGGLIDVVQAGPHFDAVLTDQTAVGGGEGTIQFADTIPSDIGPGDFVCVAGETPVCQAPLELHDVLVWRALLVMLKAKRDQVGAKMALEHLEELERTALDILSPRSEDKAEVILNPNAPGWKRNARRGYRRGV